MDAQLKERWLAALRSGAYLRGRYRLKKADWYCCLGVLCDISGRGVWKKDDDEDDYYEVDGQRQYCNLASPILAMSRLNASDEEQLIRLNDSPPEDTSFVEIADYIERNL